MAANNIYIQVDFNSQAAQQNVNALNNAIGQTGPAAAKSGKQATTALQSVNVSVQQTTHAFGELTTALAGLGIGRMVASVVQVGSELNRAQQMMEYFTGSAAEASKVLAEIRALADQTPFRFKDLEESARKLAGFGMQAREITPTLKALTDQVAAMGGSIEDVNSMIVIFGRVMGKDFVSSMDLIRKLPAEGIKVMDALRDALSRQLKRPVGREEVQEIMKAGVLDPMETWRAIMRGMQQQTGGAAALVNDAAKAFKVMGDRIDYARQKLMEDGGFGKAIREVAQEFQYILAPIAAFFGWLMKLPEPTKEMIVRIGAAAAATIALAGAWKIFIGLADPAIQAIVGIGKALATALLAVLSNPELLLGMATITAFVIGFVKLYPEQAKKLEDSATKWVGDLWGKLKDTVARLAKESGLLPEAIKIPSISGGDQPGAQNTAKALKEVQTQLDEWSASAGKTLLQALSSPAEAVRIKYQELFEKLRDLMQKNLVTGAEAEKAIAALTLTESMETQAKLFEKQKQDIGEKYKLEIERSKGSYEAQIAYIEALDAQDLRKKVAAIDKITDLRVQSASETARLEEQQLTETFEAQKNLIEQYKDVFEKAGVDVEAAIDARRAEMEAKRAVIGQRAADEEQKYRLEGWKKANDAIIEDQKRVYEAFKGEFEEIFDAFTQRTKSIGAALGDVFKKLALGEARNFFAAQGAAIATQAAGYGAPTEQITRGGGILSMLFQRGLSPRPAGPPPQQYTPAATESVLKLSSSSDRFAVGVDAYNEATIRFALAVGQMTSAAGKHEGYAERMDDSADTISGAADVFEQASSATGVSQPLLRAVAQVESGMRPEAVSPKGARGLMQLMPATMKDWGVSNAFDPQQNVSAGANQLNRLLSRYGGDIPSALAAYNMGPAAFDRAMARGRPLPAETQNYVRQVQALLTQGAVASAALPQNYTPMGPRQPQPVLAAPAVADYGYTPAGGYPPPMGYEGGYSPVGGYGSITQGAVAPEVAAAAGPSALAKALGVATGAAGALGGRGGGGLGVLQSGILSGAKFKDLFGIGGGPGGATTGYSVATSQGVAALSTMAGMALVSQGLARRQAPLTVAGGALAGVGIGRQLGFAPMGGALLGVGAGLYMAGLQRGGVGGMFMDIGGGALTGAMLGLRFGGPMGAAIGAGIGAAVGLISGIVRLFVKTESERIRAQIKQVYGVDITDRQVLAQVKQIVDTKYGGSVSIGIRSQEVQDIVRLYALSTGQAAGLPRQMYNATIEQAGGGMQLQPVYQSGVQVANPYTGPTSYQYQSAVAGAQGLMPGTSLGVPGASGLISQQWQQMTLQTIRGNPAAVANANAAAASAGDSRLTTTAAMQEPLTALS